MKKDIHPDYRLVAFKDVSCDHTILTRSTVKTDETIVLEDGKEYPLVKLQISSASHPFFTGKEKLMDEAGRIDKFNKKFGTRLALGNQKKRKKASAAKAASKTKASETLKDTLKKTIADKKPEEKK